MKKRNKKIKEREVSDLLAEYWKAINILWQYDEGKLKMAAGPKTAFVLEIEDARKVVEEIKKTLFSKKRANDVFGREYRGKFESVVKNLYQTFGGKELYKNTAEKAANIFYLLVKDHPFIDGNKRIAAFMFVYFLYKNNYLRAKTGESKISNNALVALTLLIAISHPKEKEAMVKIIANLLK